MKAFRTILFLTFALAVISQGRNEKKKRVDVASLKPRDLAEFKSQPKVIRGIIEYGLSLTEKRLGYQYGSCDPTNGGMDCSGTVYHILKHQGLNPPRSSHTIYLWVQKHGNLKEVKGATSLSDKQFAALQPGDLLFWEGTYDVGKRFPPISHVMIFAGHQKSDGRPVAIGASSGRYYAGRARHGVSMFDFSTPEKRQHIEVCGIWAGAGSRKLGEQSIAYEESGARDYSRGQSEPGSVGCRFTWTPFFVEAVDPGGQAGASQQFSIFIGLPVQDRSTPGCRQGCGRQYGRTLALPGVSPRTI